MRILIDYIIFIIFLFILLSMNIILYYTNIFYTYYSIVLIALFYNCVNAVLINSSLSEIFWHLWLKFELRICIHIIIYHVVLAL